MAWVELAGATSHGGVRYCLPNLVLLPLQWFV
jgi:hypothetical protein